MSTYMNLIEKNERMKELIEKLNKYRDAYYNQTESLVSDYEYDCLFDELQRLEEKTGTILSNSPTQTVGYEVKSELRKVKHNHPMLSLNTTKAVSDLVKFQNDKDMVLMCKMDGLTISLRYLNGELVSAETRGNGEIGEDVLHNVKTFKNVPLKINTKREVIIDGEAIITYKDFNKINESLPEGEKYKNPRNLAAGSVKQLDSSIVAQRNLKFIAWKFVKGSTENDFYNRLTEMQKLGFEVVLKTFVPEEMKDVQVTLKSNLPPYHVMNAAFAYVYHGEWCWADDGSKVCVKVLAWKVNDDVYDPEADLEEKYQNALDMDELDFYMDLLDKGFTVERVRKYMGGDAADHMQVFCLNHGLLDKHSTAELFEQICKKLQKNTGENRHGIYNEGDEIICQKKEQADAIADLFEDMGVDVMHTSQEEDGWHVYFD